MDKWVLAQTAANTGLDLLLKASVERLLYFSMASVRKISVQTYGKDLSSTGKGGKIVLMLQFLWNLYFDFIPGSRYLSEGSSSCI